MKFNLEVTIPEVIEQHTHGILKYDEVGWLYFRSTGGTLIKQGDNETLLELDQAEQLYFHLKQVFGEM